MQNNPSKKKNNPVIDSFISLHYLNFEFLGYTDYHCPF